MNMSIDELLFLASSVIILPAIAFLTISYFSGALTSTNGHRYLALRDAEQDFWTATDGTSSTQEGESR
jgi:hypothetical protein